MLNFERYIERKNHGIYDFLYDGTIDPLLVTISGSYAYGTYKQDGTSDFDVRGICYIPDKTLFGLENFEQKVDIENDTTIYTIKKFCQLALNCNPNVIEMLGNQDYFLLDKSGKLLLDNAILFLSQKAFSSFMGYANSQLRRIENNLARNTISQPDKEAHIMKSIENLLYTIDGRFTEFDEFNDVKLYIDKSLNEELDSEIFIDAKFSKYPLREFKALFTEMNNVIKEYDKLNYRNNKKDDAHLNKHLMHLVRLYYTGIQILEEGKIVTYRENEKLLLNEIRNGKYLTADGSLHESFNDLMDNLERRINYAKKNTSLPKLPDYKKVEELLIEINRNGL